MALSDRAVEAQINSLEASLERYKNLCKKYEDLLAEISYADDACKQERVFTLRYSELLEPAAAIEIFINKLYRVLEQEN